MNLKPCPFCGGTEVKAHSFGTYWAVECKDCDASGPMTWDSQRNAILGWNDAPRPVQQDPTGAVRES